MLHSASEAVKTLNTQQRNTQYSTRPRRLNSIVRRQKKSLSSNEERLQRANIQRVLSDNRHALYADHFSIHN
jgi:hypothetical protein